LEAKEDLRQVAKQGRRNINYVINQQQTIANKYLGGLHIVKCGTFDNL
jgi:hypothetical protein